MRFLPAIEWTKGYEDAVISGQIRLQTGQWIILNNGGTRSRFVCVSQGSSIWAIHPENGKIQAERFKETVKSWKN